MSLLEDIKSGADGDGGQGKTDEEKFQAVLDNKQHILNNGMSDPAQVEADFVLAMDDLGFGPELAAHKAQEINAKVDDPFIQDVLRGIANFHESNGRPMLHSDLPEVSRLIKEEARRR
ncbi:hypothetical protein CMI37_11285 [Candidatus Pacearchaeota archaeon]|nr:hypothetical protein [Candidatus Pacearchaeota archaeon]|tara:strand:+ start:1942 stop:2295 length:354 start_codon:yes stop_codon:yes gene_type:complete